MSRATGRDCRFCAEVLRDSVREVIDNRTNTIAAYLGVEKTHLNRFSFGGIIVIGHPGRLRIGKGKRSEEGCRVKNHAGDRQVWPGHCQINK